MKISTKIGLVTSVILFISLSLAAQPTTQATNIVFSGVTTTQMTLNWTSGDGNKRIVVAHQGAAVDSNPVNGTNYADGGNVFGSGTQIGTGNYVVYDGNTSSVTVTGLTAGTIYHFRVFEYNSGGTLYLTTSGTGNPASQSTLATEPTTQASAITFSSVTDTQLNVSWTNGNGSTRIVLAHQGATVDANPADGTSYTANAAFGSGTQVGTGNYVAYIGSGTNVTVTGLTAGTTYHFKVYEFNGTSGAENYNITAPPANSRSTLAAEPSTQATNIVFSAVGTVSYTLTWTNGNGAERIVIAKQGSAVDVDPTDGTTYTGNSDFSAATDIGSGNKVVFRGSGNSVGLTGLTAGTIYHFKVYELNGSAGTENYNLANATGNPANRSTIAAAPSEQPTSLVFSNITTSQMDLSYTAAGGALLPDGYFVLRAVGAAPDTDPTDGTSYSVGNTIGTGTVVFNGAGTSFTDGSLSAATDYYYKIYSFRGTGGGVNYFTGIAPLAGNHTTLATEPTTQATDIVFSSLNTTSYTLTWTNGNGANRIVVAHQGAAVDANPADGTAYTANAAFGSGTQIGTGNYVVFNGSGNSVAVTGLTANTEYHFRVYEYNGSSATQNNYMTATASGNPANRFTLIAQPGTQATAITFSSVTVNSMNVNYTNGNGTSRILVARQGSAVSFTPVDGTVYAVNNDFSAAADLGSGNKIVGSGSGAIAVTGLSAGTTYHFSVFEYSGASGSENYNTTSPPVNNRTTLSSEPTTQAHDIVFSGIGTTTVTLTWTNGNGSERLVVASTSAITAGENPVDGTTYTGNANFTSASSLGSGKIVFRGAGNTVAVTNLTVNTNYFFKVYELNGSGGTENYYTADGSAGNPSSQTTLATEPSNHVTSLATGTITSTSIQLNWTGSTGATLPTKYLIIAKKNTGGTYQTVVDGTAIADDNDFSDVNKNGAFNANHAVGANTYTWTGLDPFTAYDFLVYPYTGTSGSINYKTSATVPTVSATTLCTPPTVQASSVTFGTTTASSTVVNWTRGNGDQVLVLARDGAAAAVTPVNGTSYTPSTTFGSGDNIAIGGNDYFAVYTGTGTTVTVGSLSGNTAYNYKVFEINNTGVCYNTTSPASGDKTTPAASSSTTLSAGTGVATISSLVNTQGAEVNAFTFTVTDLGDDGTSTRFTQLIFRPGAGNQISDWTQLIAGAELYDNFSNGPSEHSAAVIASNTITISGINIGGGAASNNDLGTLTDGTTKIYTLKIWLKSSLGGTLPSTVDGLHLEISLTQADVSAVAGKTQFAPGTNASSGGANDQISVVATQIKINQQPSTTANATVALATQPIFEAADANNNRDLGFNFAITVNTTNPTNLGPASAPSNFASGLADFTASGFNFTNTGTSTMSVTANSIASPNSNSITVSANTAVAQLGNSVVATNGISSSPLSSSSLNKALLGFSLTTTGSTLNFTGLTLSTSSDPDGKIKNIELYHSTTNDYSTGALTLIGSGTTPTAASINFTGFTRSINGSDSYFFVVADIEDNVFASTPQLQLTLTPTTGVVVSLGSVSGGAFSGLNYSFIDTTAPTILSVTNNTNPIYEGALTQTVTVIFSEPMNPLTQPTITLSGTNWGVQNSLGWSTTTLVNDTYKATFTHNGTQQAIAAATSSITSPSGAQDVAGNSDTGGGTSASFVLDTQKPTATVTVDTNPIYTGDLVQTVTVKYSESMNNGTSPVITFNSSTHFTPAGPGAWSTTTFTNDTWTRTFNHDGTAETIPADFAVVTNSSGAKDVAGNNEVGDTSPTFLIDTKGPINVDISSPTANGTYTTGAVITIYVYYDETVIVTGTPTLTLSSGGTASYTSNVTPSILSFSYTVGPGENATDLDVTALNLSGGTIKDGVTNNASLALPAANRDLSFYKNINIDTQTPTIVSVSSTAANGSYGVGNTIFIQVVFTEPVFVTGTPQLALNSGGTALYNSGSGTSTLTFRYDISTGQNVADLDYVNTSSLSLPGGALIRDIVSINADLTLATPGAANSISDNQDIIIDSVYPTATAIDISSPTVSWRPDLNGTSATSITFLVTFDENVIGVDASDFTVNAGASLSFTSPVVVTGANNTRTVTINGVTLLNYNGTGQIKINLINNGTITDNAGNALSSVPTTAFTGNDFYTILFPEPVDPPINFSVSASTTTSITVQYGQPVAPVNPVHAYWVQHKKTTDPTFLPALVDGVWDGGVTPYFFGSAPVMTTLVPNLISGYSYDFRIVSTSYSGYYSGDLLDYFTGVTLNGTATPPVAAQSTLSFISSSSTISSLITASNGTPVFTFSLDEDGAADGADNAPTKFNQLVITPGATNNIANWTTAIAGAQLVDSNGKFVNGTVNAGNITFSSIPASDPDNGGSPDLGFVPDNIVKQFTLRVWLQNPLGVADNSRLDFHIANTSFTYENTTDTDETSQNSSQLAGSVLESGTVKVDVTATKLVFTTDTPGSPAQIGVKTNFPVPPVVRAFDVNNNLDLDYNNTFTVTTSIANFNGHTNFTSGILTLSNFNFTAPGTSTITISGNAGGIYPALTGANQAVSSSVTAVISGLTQITPGATAEPATISSLITTLAGAVQVFDYTITDDAGANVVTFQDNDGLPTLITQMIITQGTGNDANLNTWTNAIQGATLSDGNTTIAGTVNATNITFTGINTLGPAFIPPAGGLGYIADNATKTYRLKIYLKNPVTSIADVIDNKDFVFDISQNEVTTGVSPSSSTLQASTTNSGDGNNAVSVIATRLDFTTQWVGIPPAAQSYDAPLSPTPVAKARDANGNVDIDYAAAATVLTANPATYPLANATVTNTLSGGTRYFAFDPNLQVTSAGGGLDGQTTNLVLSSGSLTNGISNTFELNYSGNSDIINASFTYPQDILYAVANNQVSDITAGTGLAMEKFTVRDGGGSSDSDGSATKLSSITLEVTNYQYLRRLALYNENTGDEIGDLNVVAGPNVVVISPGVAEITFSGIALSGVGSFQAADDNNNNLIVKASFNATGVIDNEVINFRVVDVVAGGVSSAFTLGASTSYPALAATENQIEVVATQIDFTSQPNPTNISTYTDINNPYIELQSRDANANLDLDYNGAIGTISNTGTTGTGPSGNLVMVNVPTGNFVSGVYSFQDFDIANSPNTFQFLEDSGPGTIQLVVPVTTNNQLGALPTTATSSAFAVAASFESWVTNPATMNLDGITPFDQPDYIPYENYQTADITGASNGFELVQLVVSDGDADGAAGDIDGAATVLNTIKFGVTNYAAIRRIAIYDENNVELLEKDGSTITAVSGSPYQGEVDFDLDAVNKEIIAPDDQQKLFRVFATFKNTPSVISDTMHIRLSLRGATLGGGSKFYDDGSLTYVAGKSPYQLSAPAGKNKIEVTATSFDFVTQASNYAGITEPIGAQFAAPPLPSTTSAIVHARDKFGIRDLDFTYPDNQITITGANPLSTSDFVNGILDLDSMYYTSTGNGTIGVAMTDIGGVIGYNINSSTPASNTTGTITSLTSSTAITGVGTLFLTDLAIGSRLNNSAGVMIGTVASIASNTSLTLTGNAQITVTNASYNTNSIPGQLVNVVHVAATLPGSGIIVGSGSPPTFSMKGGSQSQVIFGVTFTPNSATANEPLLRKFSFAFDQPFHFVVNGEVTDIFQNFVVKEGSTDITAPTIQGTLMLSSSTGSPTDQDKVTVDLTAIPRPLFSGPLTYYLIADVNATANISTPNLTPMFIDDGYDISSGINNSFRTITDANIEVTKGTATGSFFGNTYSFASTKPPTLIATEGSNTSPFRGQLNVDAGLTSIALEFDVPVGSLDGGLNGGAALYNRTTNKKVANLIARSGAGNYLSTGDYKNVISPLIFDINFLPGQSFKADTVYYVTVKKGSFDPLAQPLPTGEGISDQGLNFFGGISSNSVLYFKISSNQPLLLNDITSSFNNESIGSLSTEFDQFGTAYYLIVPIGSPAPTTSEVKLGNYTAATIAASGSYTIEQINTLQTVTFPASFVAGQDYDVYLYAENDANPTPVSSGGIYGSDLLANSGGPTLQISISSFPASSNYPSYLICPNSNVTVTKPIIIGETFNSEFESGSLQNFNILLPTGYEFDITSTPNIQLIGNDFEGGVATTVFESNTLLNISYTNNPLFGSSSIDYIIISNLTIKGATGSQTLSIRRFYGSNTLFPAVTDLALIGLFPSTTFSFDNSFSASNAFPPPSPAIVNAIPDNYVDVDPAIEGSVRLIPKITVPNDYNASIFSGNGVTNDLLTLSAVETNTAFNITMTHTDPNGCISLKNEQYLVYDHRDAISVKLGNSNSVVNPPGTAQALTNTGFPGSSPALASPTIFHNELAGYELMSLTADLPVGEKLLNSQGLSSQIITGADWQKQIGKILLPPTSVTLPIGTYYNYQWNYAHILNALSESNADRAAAVPAPTLPNSVKKDPYNNFVDTVLSTKNLYWKGGSLGKVEFTGVYRSTADLSVVVPFRQNVELFLPAIPLIEIGSNNQSSRDSTDATVNNFDSKTPEQHVNLFQYVYPNKDPNKQRKAGTPIFCEAGGLITLNGFPAAVPGTSTGTFALYDYKTFNFTPGAINTPLLTSSPNSAFIDNGNGNATINPQNNAIRNNYADVLVAYTYQENSSPAQGTGYLVIRITPNPVANFTNSIYTCEKTAISFNDNSNIAQSANYSITKWIWNFDDNQSVLNIATAKDTVHQFTQPGNYNVRHTVFSQYGCTSTPQSKIVSVGAIPDVRFSFIGISTADAIQFTSQSTVRINTPSPTIASLNWNFGDGNQGTGNTPSNQYSSAGLYSVRLIATSAIGCKDTLVKDLVILSKVTPTANTAYEEKFESGGGTWQPSTLPNALDIEPVNPSDPVSPYQYSWAVGTPTNIQIDAVVNGTSVWKTNLSGTYRPREKSFLYSPSFDISQLARPMISFNTFTHLENSDGVVLEYSVDDRNVADPNKLWFTVGAKGEGYFWFTDQGLISKPGKQILTNDFGWSGSAKEEWLESKHALVNEGQKPNIVGVQRVVFRFAFASAKIDQSTLKGFAVDNVRIGNRTRIVLLENFTNLGNATTNNNGEIIEDKENAFLKTFNPSGTTQSIVRINYYVGFPKQDPLNMDNPQDPGARALYYNVSQTPRVKMDGEGGNAVFSAWGPEAYSVRSLKLADAEITPQIIYNTDGSIDVSVSVKALKNLSDRTIVQIAIVEKAIDRASLAPDMQSLVKRNETQYEYVLKKLLPTAAGTRFNQILPINQSRTFGPYRVAEDIRVYNPINDLAVVVFLQNEQDINGAREVYQTEILDLNDPSITTGIEDLNTSFNVYPIPTDKEMVVELPEPAEKRIALQMFDQMGKEVHQSHFEKGDSSKNVNTSEFAAGVYLIQIDSPKGVLRRKVMVVHHN